MMDLLLIFIAGDELKQKRELYRKKHGKKSAPSHSCNALKKWLRDNPETDFIVGNEDEWKDVCEKKSKMCIKALVELSAEGFEPLDRWKSALDTWATVDMQKSDLESIIDHILLMPEEKFKKLVDVTFCLLSRNVEKSIFIDNWRPLAQKIISTHIHDASTVHISSIAKDSKNHPIGKITDYVIKLYRGRPTEKKHIYHFSNLSSMIQVK